MRFTSWSLFKSLKRLCALLCVVFGDFNKIDQSNDKLGWLDGDARQIEAFRECLTDCGLIDLGFVGQGYTWCNGRIGEQHTLVRLDRIMANERWLNMFMEAKVYHRAMAVSDHCLLSLSLRQWSSRRGGRKWFMFEAMWTRKEGCRKVIKEA